jgi:hypothetical protein
MISETRILATIPIPEKRRFARIRQVPRSGASKLLRMQWTFGRGLFGAGFILLGAIVATLQFVHPTAVAPLAPFAHLADEDSPLSLGASLNAFGASREVRLRFALPNKATVFPVEVSGDPAALSYAWVPSRDTSVYSVARPVNGGSFIAPSEPGYYHLAIVRGTDRQILADPTLAVMVPFEQKIGGRLNGYKIGTYLAEKLGRRDHPSGFLQVTQADVGLKVSKHLKLGDFITHDQADVWPKYVALNPRLLDKLELVLAKIGGRTSLQQLTGEDESQDVAFDVHSGFRTPAHNSGVQRAAKDSRHQYGDAADVAIDADGDGRVTLQDEVIVARAVDQVEHEHPDLIGGLGLYTSRRYRTPYVHIDARGKRSRWKG